MRGPVLINFIRNLFNLSRISPFSPVFLLSDEHPKGSAKSKNFYTFSSIVELYLIIFRFPCFSFLLEGSWQYFIAFLQKAFLHNIVYIFRGSLLTNLIRNLYNFKRGPILKIFLTFHQSWASIEKCYLISHFFRLFRGFDNISYPSEIMCPHNFVYILKTPDRDPYLLIKPFYSVVNSLLEGRNPRRKYMLNTVPSRFPPSENLKREYLPPTCSKRVSYLPGPKSHK